jgi:hypothetical protein
MFDDTATGTDFGAALAGPGDLASLYRWDVSIVGTNQLSTVSLTQNVTREEIVFPETTIDDPDGDPGEGLGYGSEFNFPDLEPPKRFEPPRIYDPEFAIAYDYSIGDADNAFAEVYLPFGIGDNDFVLTVTDPDSPLLGESYEVTAEMTDGDGLDFVLDFLAIDPNAGVGAFRLTGIEFSAMIGADDPLGFPTGFTFANDNAITLRQTSIVPEPASAAVLAFGGLLLRRRR